MIIDLLAAAQQAQGGASIGATQLIVAVLGAGGIGAILAAVVTGLFSKKKLGAEAAEIITKAAAGVVTNLETENARITKKMIEQAASHAEELDEFRRVLMLHSAWDAIARSELQKVGIELPEPPPLLPARRFDHPTVH